MQNRPYLHYTGIFLHVNKTCTKYCTYDYRFNNCIVCHISSIYNCGNTWRGMENYYSFAWVISLLALCLYLVQTFQYALVVCSAVCDFLPLASANCVFSFGRTSFCKERIPFAPLSSDFAFLILITV